MRTTHLLTLALLALPAAAAAQQRPEPAAPLAHHLKYLLEQMSRDTLASLRGARCRVGPRPTIEICDTRYPLEDWGAPELYTMSSPAGRSLVFSIPLGEAESQGQIGALLGMHSLEEALEEAAPAGWHHTEVETTSRWLRRWTECPDGSGRVLTIQAEGVSRVFLTANVAVARRKTC